MTGVSVAGVVSYETDYGILLISVCQNSPQGGVRKVKHSSVRIENPLLALYRGTGYFSSAWAFRTAWGGRLFQAGGYTQSKSMVRLQEPPKRAPSGFSPEITLKSAE